MATKKQKRQAALEKRAKFMEEQQALGLAAQRRSQEEYEQRIRESEERQLKADVQLRQDPSCREFMILSLLCALEEAYVI
jgi:hypothetical protein